MKCLTIILCVIFILPTSEIGNYGDGGKTFNQNLFYNHFESYNHHRTVPAFAKDNKHLLKQRALIAYEARDFEIAVNLFDELVLLEPSAANYFYLAMSHLEMENTEAAIQHFNVTINNFTELKAPSKWYLALAHLLADNEEEAISNLVSLTLENSIYKSKAESLLKELGLTASSLDYGIITDVKIRPNDDDDPDGSYNSFENRRQIQFGYVISETDGYRYYFITDQPIRSLHVGSEVEMIILRKSERTKVGLAFILGER